LTIFLLPVCGWSVSQIRKCVQSGERRENADNVREKTELRGGIGFWSEEEKGKEEVQQFGREHGPSQPRTVCINKV